MTPGTVVGGIDGPVVAGPVLVVDWPLLVVDVVGPTTVVVGAAGTPVPSSVEVDASAPASICSVAEKEPTV